jgi:hypothetical protein
MTRITLRLLACAALLATPLAFMTQVHATEVDEEIQAAAPAHGGPAHEQWEALRAEHQQLVAEHDRLLERCMNVKGQDKSACDQKGDDLRARYENWRGRMEAFHDKGGAKHEGIQWHHKKGMKHAPKADKAEAPADGKMMHHHHHHHGMKSQSSAPAAPAGDTSGQ